MADKTEWVKLERVPAPPPPRDIRTVTVAGRSVSVEVGKWTEVPAGIGEAFANASMPELTVERSATKPVGGGQPSGGGASPASTRRRTG